MGWQVGESAAQQVERERRYEASGVSWREGTRFGIGCEWPSAPCALTRGGRGGGGRQ